MRDSASSFGFCEALFYPLSSYMPQHIASELRLAAPPAPPLACSLLASRSETASPAPPLKLAFYSVITIYFVMLALVRARLWGVQRHSLHSPSSRSFRLLACAARLED